MLRSSNMKVVLSVVSMCLIPLVLGQGCPAPAGSNTGGSLEGTWSGQITMNMTMASSTTGPADINDPNALTFSYAMPLTISYSATGVPSSLPVMGMEAGAGQPDSSDTTSVMTGQTSTIEINGITVTVTIREASYTATHSHVVSDTTTSGQTSTPMGPGSDMVVSIDGVTTQTIDSALSADGTTLSWTQTSEGTTQSTSTAGGMTFSSWTAQKVDLTGTLTRQ